MSIKRRTGFTVVEMIIAVSIAAFTTLLASTFFYQGFRLWRLNQYQIEAQNNIRTAVRSLVAELREARTADNGAYPIEAAAPTTITFFSNIDADANQERIRYFIQGTDLLKGVTNPTGVPATYPPANETVTTVASFIRNTDPFFTYFPDTYAGTGQSMTVPVVIGSVRLVKISVTVDSNLTEYPAATRLETSVSLRNLKDNLGD